MTATVAAMSVQAVTTASNDGAAPAAAADAGNGASAASTTAAAASTTTNTPTPTPDAAKAAADAASATAANVTSDAAKAEAAKAAAAADIALALPKDALIPVAMVEEVKAFAKEHGITGKAAQAILDGRNAAVAADRQAEGAAFTKLVQAWEGEIKADAELGGDHYDANMALIDKTLQSFASEKLLKDLESSGLIHQPEFRRLLLRVGKSGSEDGLSAARSSSNVGAQQQSEEAALKARYPKMYAAG